jgi:hypothetical protein
MPYPPEAPQRIRDKIARGTLTVEPPRRMYASYGTGTVCDGCGEPITHDQIEYEWELPSGRFIHMHLGCASLLEAERRRHEGTTPNVAFHFPGRLGAGLPKKRFLDR